MLVDDDGNGGWLAVVCLNANANCPQGIFWPQMAGFMDAVAPPNQGVGKRTSCFLTYFGDLFLLFIKEQSNGIFADGFVVLIFKRQGENCN